MVLWFWCDVVVNLLWYDVALHWVCVAVLYFFQACLCPKKISPTKARIWRKRKKIRLWKKLQHKQPLQDKLTSLKNYCPPPPQAEGLPPPSIRRPKAEGWGGQAFGLRGRRTTIYFLFQGEWLLVWLLFFHKHPLRGGWNARIFRFRCGCFTLFAIFNPFLVVILEMSCVLHLEFYWKNLNFGFRLEFLSSMSFRSSVTQNCGNLSAEFLEILGRINYKP